MRITIVLGAFLPVPPIMGGAVEKAWFALGQELARRGHEVVQISRALPELARTEMIEGVRHIRVPGYDTPGSLLWLKTLDFFYSLRAKNALPLSDILVTNTFWLPMFLRNATRGRLYVHVARYPKGQMRFYRHSARLQAPSNSIVQAIVGEVPGMKSKITKIPYPRPNAAGEGVPPFSTREQKIIYVGRLHPEKGVHLLVGAITDGPWKLVIIGPWEHQLGGGGEGYWRELRALAAKKDGLVEFRGPIFEPEKLEFEFRTARLFVYPSLAEQGETFGLAPLEAMTHGCPVLVSNLECFHDFIRDGETGFIFDHRAANPGATLRSKITDLIANESLLARVAEAGYRQSEEYALPRVADQFIQDFKAVIEDSHGRDADR